jgi:branched-chain amino acid transport system permease protein
VLGGSWVASQVRIGRLISGAGLLFEVLARALAYSGVLSLVCMGFTLIHVVEGVPNLSQGAFMALGVYVTYTVGVIWGESPYLGLPVAAVLGALVGVLCFYAVIRPLSGRVDDVYMTLATLGLQIIIVSLVYVYAYWIREEYHLYPSGFLLSRHGLDCGGYPLVTMVSTVLCLSTAFCLHRAFSNRWGIALRATAESRGLAEVSGVDTNRLRASTWLVSCGLSCLAGSVYALLFPGTPYIGGTIMSTVMGACILGGLCSVFWTLIGGFLMGFSMTLLPGALLSAFGEYTVSYYHLLPLLTIVCVFLLEPRGLQGVYERVAFPGTQSSRSELEK